MLNIKDVGVTPYESAKPQKKKSSFQRILLLLDFIIKLVQTIVFSIPIIYGLLKNCVIPPPKKEIAGQLALVTGGANGLGREICLCLAKQGCNVVVVDIDINNAERTASNCRQFHIKSKAYKVDVSNFEEVQQLCKQIEIDLGPVDILINNAGILAALSLREGTPADIDRIIKVNLTSHFFTIRVFLESMIRRRKGHIVAICSIAGLVPAGRAICYSATKTGVRGLMDALYDELCLDHCDKYIHTTTVYPYFINTRKEISDLTKHSSAFDKISFLLPDETAYTIVDAIRKNNKSLTIPRTWFPVINYLMHLPIELIQLTKKIFVDDVPKIHCK